MPSPCLRSLPSRLVPLVLLGLAGLARSAPPARDVEPRVNELLARMTVEEKIGQLQQLDSVPNTWAIRDEHRDLASRGLVGSFLNIRGAKAINEAQRLAVEKSRLRIPLLFGFDVIHGYRVIFPTPLAEASSWDPAVAERAAGIAAAEAASTGLKWTFAPMVDIARDPRWGRIMEGSGEDPYLGSVLAAARVRGFQGDDPAAPDRVLACAKHWVAYGAAEGGRDYNTAELSEHTLRTTYFPPFRAALDAGAQTFMCSFNTIDGVPASANPFTLTKVLRDEWHFDGLLVSDYESIKEMIAHRTAADGADAARQALNAGVDMEMVSRLFAEHLPKLMEQGKVPPAKLDEAVRRILRVKFRAGLFEHPYVDESREAKVVGAREHRAAAREIAARSTVLLKNDGGLLPIKPATRAIAVIGPLADDPDAPLSHWRGDGRVEDTVTLFAGLRSKVQGRGDVQVTYAKGCDIEGDSVDGFPEAVRLARQAELAIVAVGESSAMSGEAGSRSSLDLPGHQLNLVKTIQATGVPTVVVLYNGRPLTIGWIADHVPAIVEAWLPGTEGGNALADVLFGDVNPGGKLPVTFPRTVGQVPIYYNALSTGRPAKADNRYTSKYIDLPSDPQFPFGYGLSYTRFELSSLTLSAKSIAPDGKLTVSVDVKNVGDRPGDEVVQLYLRDEVSSVARPVKELAGFRRVTLPPGGTQTVRFELGPDRLGFLDANLRFVVEPGQFQVTAGTSSVGGLTEGFEVAGP
ncbi:beta-glucosidase BglX [Aquisphaera insulae]|uniref:beta-glucosidase BglX n=1 Tax=Aquisphaera insulae TaxID=2712864 RepID=UPI0013EC121B|nr:beta-glucosidase BglX [Aquisphaera insulae]